MDNSYPKKSSHDNVSDSETLQERKNLVNVKNVDFLEEHVH